jgi:hypothetical protein
MGERLSRIYRGHRIVVVRLGVEWHAIVHSPRGGNIVARDIKGKTIRDAMARGVWIVETRLAFRPPASGERQLG